MIDITELHKSYKTGGSALYGISFNVVEIELRSILQARGIFLAEYPGDQTCRIHGKLNFV